MVDPLKIHAVADGELCESELKEYQAQICQCKRSSAELQAIHAVKGVLAKAEPVACEDSWRKCVQRLDAIDKTKSVESWVSKYAWGLCGGLFLFIVSGSLLHQASQNNVLSSSEVPRMVSGMGSLPFGGKSEARNWISSHAPESQSMLQRDLLVARGGAMGYVSGHRVVRLNLQDSRGDLIFVIVSGANQLEGAPADQQNFQLGQFDHFNYVAWSDKNQLRFLIGDRSQDDLRQIAEGSVSH
jgi:hypothetical protein